MAAEDPKQIIILPENSDQRLEAIRMMQQDIKDGKLEASDLVNDGLCVVQSQEGRDEEGKIVRVDTVIPSNYVGRISDKVVKTPQVKRRKGDEGTEEEAEKRRVSSSTSPSAPSSS